MSTHLLAISIGPVQDFIAAARRTRDLWFGSYLLSEISKAVALEIYNNMKDTEGKLIFPAPEDSENDLNKQSPLNVANVILVELHQLDPKSISNNAQQAAQLRWREFTNDALNEAKEFVDTNIWNEQIDDVVEFYSAWTPLRSTGEYINARQRVMRLLAGRKACRSFTQAIGHWGRPKSSLDGARETVWKQSLTSDEEVRKRDLRINTGEQLDIIGITKRLGGGKQSYPSVSRISVDPWLRNLQKSDLELFDELKHHCKNLQPLGLTGIKSSRWPQYSEFPFEGSVLYPTRHKELLEENQLPQDTFDGLSTVLTKVQRLYGAPSPYLAMLVADGDHMGKAIARITTPEQHRQFSQQLSKFAELAGNIVAEHFGCLIYAGGDDVMALLPVDQCLICSRKLHDEFGKLMQSWQANDSQLPTFSVGIAIGHFMEPLEDLLNWAREAEKSAKLPDRDGLALHLNPRAGEPLSIRGRWTDETDERLLTWIHNFERGELPSRVAYDVRQLAKVYANWPDKQNTRQAVVADLKRILRKKQAKGASLNEALVEKVLHHWSIAGTENRIEGFNTGVMELANEWLIAQHLAQICNFTNRQIALIEGADL